MDITENGKYYIPTIEEFHVGFEFQADLAFRNYVFTDDYLNYPTSVFASSLKQVEAQINALMLRVKCLDQEDIISLGWTKGCSYSPNNSELSCYDYGKREIHFDSKNHVVIISCGENESIELEIKNKSELQRLMKQLGV